MRRNPRQQQVPSRRLRGKAGQAIVLLALTATLMIGGVGAAVDLAVGYLYSIAAEPAATGGSPLGGRLKAQHIAVHTDGPTRFSKSIGRLYLAPALAQRICAG